MELQATRLALLKDRKKITILYLETPVRFATG